MSESPNLVLPYIEAAQAQKHVTHNEAIRALDALVQLAVLDRDLASPPASPAEGARYIVAASPTGAWSGHAGRIAAFQDGAWMIYTPREGWIAWLADENVGVVYDGAAWVGFGSSGSGAAIWGVNATADTTNRLAVSAPAALFNHEGAGHQLKINKAASADTASVLFQTAFSGRAEFGLTGDDNWHVKVSADGTTFKEALVADRASGAIGFPLTPAIAGQNLLINGDFQINQRAFSGGALAANAYGFDRWKASGSGVSVTRSGFDVTLTIATFGSDYLVQVIEPAQFGFANLASTTLTVSVENPSVDMQVFVGATATGVITAGSGRRSVTLTTTAADTGNIQVWFSRNGAGAVTFRRAKVEFGPVASAWQPRPADVERRLCWRYYQKSYFEATAPGSNTYEGIAQAIIAHPQWTAGWRWRVPMRATPTVTVWTPVGVVGRAASFANGSVTYAVSVNSPSREGVWYLGSSGMGNGGGFVDFVDFHWRAEAEL